MSNETVSRPVKRDVSRLFRVLVLGGMTAAGTQACADAASNTKSTCTDTDAGQVCTDAGSGGGGGVRGW